MTKPIYAVKPRLTPLQRIMQKTGRKTCECKCKLCKAQCHTPCLGTPQDILQIMDAGYTDRLKPMLWGAGMLLGVIDQPVQMIQAEQTGVGDFDPNARCTFFKDGLCEIHNLGLKPTEGRLSHHSTRIDNFKRNKSIAWNVVQEWLNPDNADVVEEVERRYEQYINNSNQQNNGKERISGAKTSAHQANQ